MIAARDPLETLVLVPTPLEARVLFGRKLERELVHTGTAVGALGSRSVNLALCGFGLAAAGAGAAHALAQARPAPAQALLVGLAGTYDPERAPVGSVIVATSVRSDGIGVGSGSDFRSAGEIGWPQGVALSGLAPVADCVALTPWPKTDGAVQGELLSVASGSATPTDATARAHRFPTALAEEMEGFAVALAARLAQIPLGVVRGVANVAGQRDPASWKVDEALAAVRTLLDRR